MKFLYSSLVLVFLHIFVGEVHSQNANVAEDLRRETSSFFQAGSPGGSILVMRKGEVLLKEAIGMADMELNVPLKPENVFSIGSISKQFAAVAILKLQEAGKLSVDDVITKHLTDYPLNGKTITIRHLLNHTSGIPNYTDMKEFNADNWRKDVTTQGVIDFFKDKPLDFEPGTAWNYSNSAYILLGAIVEKVTGKPYGDYITEEFFQKLGMKNAHWGSMEEIIQNRAKGYTPDGKGGFVNASYISMTWPLAAGSIMCTTEDLYTWTKAVNEYKVISKASLDQAYQPTKLADGSEISYGFGWELHNIKGSRVIEHGGGINGFVSNALYLPAEDVFVAILINQETNGGTELAGKLAGIAIGKPYIYGDYSVEENEMKEYVGVYKNAKDQKRTITYNNGRLYSQRPGGMKYAMMPFAPDKFVFEGSLNEVHFTREKKKVAGLDFESRTQPFEKWTRTDEEVPVVKEVTIEEKKLLGYVGEYALAPDFNIVVTVEKGKIYMQPTNQPKFELHATDATHFFTNEVDAAFTFVTDKDGKATTLILDQGGAHLEGKKIK